MNPLVLGFRDGSGLDVEDDRLISEAIAPSLMPVVAVRDAGSMNSAVFWSHWKLFAVVVAVRDSQDDAVAARQHLD